MVWKRRQAGFWYKALQPTLAGMDFYKLTDNNDKKKPHSSILTLGVEKILSTEPLRIAVS